VTEQMSPAAAEAAFAEWRAEQEARMTELVMPPEDYWVWLAHQDADAERDGRPRPVPEVARDFIARYRHRRLPLTPEQRQARSRRLFAEAARQQAIPDRLDALLARPGAIEALERVIQRELDDEATQRELGAVV
jgi:hypothetical protein